MMKLDCETFQCGFYSVKRVRHCTLVIGLLIGSAMFSTDCLQARLAALNIAFILYYALA